jgi:acyl carrier protein
MTIRETIRDYIITHCLQGAAAALDDAAPLVTTGILDSIGVLGLVDFIESQYGLEFLPREVDLNQLETVERICQVVERKLQAKGEAS